MSRCVVACSESRSVRLALLSLGVQSTTGKATARRVRPALDASIAETCDSYRRQRGKWKIGAARRLDPCPTDDRQRSNRRSRLRPSPFSDFAVSSVVSGGSFDLVRVGERTEEHSFDDRQGDS